MNIDNAKVGDIIPFLLTFHPDKAFRWKDIHYSNNWRMGKIVRIMGDTLYFKDLLIDSDDSSYASITRPYLKDCLRVADNMKLAECIVVFAAQQAASMQPVQQPIKIEVKDTKAKVLELNKNTRYLATDAHDEPYLDGIDTAKTLDEWRDFFVNEFDDDEDSIDSVTFYAETNLKLKIRKTIEASID